MTESDIPPLPHSSIESTPDKKTAGRHRAPKPNGDGWFKKSVLTLILVAIVALMGLFAEMVRPGPLQVEATVIIPHGESTHAIGDQLQAQGVVNSGLVFRLAAKTIGYDVLRAGEYQFVAGQSMADIVLIMHEGRSVVHKFTVAEGLTSAEIVHLLKDSIAMSGALTDDPAEGSLLPETYLYSYGDTRAGMISRMQKNMQSTLAELWSKRDPSSPATSPEEVVIMASVVEKETGKASERPRVAGVFYNRLKEKMRLQSDPTVIYAIAKSKGFMDHDIDHEDLTFASPYNTYINDGLPPGPICNPGRASLEAALRPEVNDFLFFVADGTGGHVFARNLAEHNQNVARWMAIKQKTP